MYDAGYPSGAPVVFHHGTPMSGRPFRPHVELADRLGLRLVSYDRAGYGDSTRDAGRSVADVAGDVSAVADALGFDRFATWGISGGGPHALACAALLPDRVAAVATIASVAPADADDLDFTAGMGEGNIAEFGLALEGEEALRPALEAEAAGLVGADLARFAEAFAPHLSDVDAAAVEGELGAYLLECTQTGLARGVDGWVDDDLAFRGPWGFDVDAIEAPALLVQGRQDLMVPFEHGEWLARRLPGCEARLFEDEGHLTPLLSRSRELYEWLLARL
jgi:pimeloyl-ACP methyl ester carboxylesterase